MSIMDVAKVAGVSIATVSRVVNGLSGVSQERAKLVRRAIHELGYQPRSVARRTAARVAVRTGPKSSAIALVVVDGLYQYTPGIFLSHLKGIESGAREHGMELIVLQSTDADHVQAALQQGQVEGLILMGSAGSPELIESLERFPLVWMSSHRGSSDDAVLAGNYRIGSLAAEYLVGRGHQSIGFLSAMGQYPAYPARAEAFEFAAQRGKVSAAVFICQAPGASHGTESEMIELRTSLDQLVEQMLAQKPKITGLFVPNDMMTAMVYPALDRRGVKPGRDIDIISCNNEATYLLGLRPRPATIDIGAETMGRRSVEMLLWRIRHPEDSRQVQVAVEPVLHESQDW